MNHDAAMAVVDYSSGIGEVLWAAHAERYSKVKNDHYLNWAIVNEANTYGPFNKVVYYEKPLLKKTRQLAHNGRCFELYRNATMAFGSF